ncbi:hypothetical protein OFM39_36685, partial [Escherichia coli]|nr:hypothetical protein [Escherichia coli]
MNSVDPHEEIVLQFKEEILQFPQEELEARSIQELLERSQYGILYSTDTKKALLPKLQQMLECEGYKRYLL